jgi:signal transduction histidine kinase
MAGWIVAVINPLFATIAFIKFVMEYAKSRDRVVLAFALALLLWATASIFLSLLWDPNQVAELIYMTNAMGGLALIGVAMVIDAVVEPFKTLETEIHKRTEELEESKTETELFLSAWTHKVGNVLQGITTYMDLIGRAASTGKSIAGYQREAGQLNWEARTINRQVTWLSQVKSSSGLPLIPVSISQAVSKAVKSIAELAEDRIIQFTPSDDEVRIWADDNIDLLFTGLFSHCVLGPGRSADCVSVRCLTEDNRVVVEVEVKTGSSVDGMREFLQSKDLPEVVTLDLDIYMTRLLLHRYGASVDARNKKGDVLLLGFRRANG